VRYTVAADPPASEPRSLRSSHRQGAFHVLGHGGRRRQPRHHGGTAPKPGSRRLRPGPAATSLRTIFSRFLLPSIAVAFRSGPQLQHPALRHLVLAPTLRVRIDTPAVLLQVRAEPHRVSDLIRTGPCMVLTLLAGHVVRASRCSMKSENCTKAGCRGSGRRRRDPGWGCTAMVPWWGCRRRPPCPRT